MGAGAGTKQETMRRSRSRILSLIEGRATGLADGQVMVAAVGAAVVVMKLPFGSSPSFQQTSQRLFYITPFLPHPGL